MLTFTLYIILVIYIIFQKFMYNLQTLRLKVCDNAKKNLKIKKIFNS